MAEVYAPVVIVSDSPAFPFVHQRKSPATSLDAQLYGVATTRLGPVRRDHMPDVHAPIAVLQLCQNAATPRVKVRPIRWTRMVYAGLCFSLTVSALTTVLPRYLHVLPLIALA